VRKFPLILRLILVTSIFLSIIPAQALADFCQTQTTKSPCCAAKTDHDCKKDCCGCIKQSKAADAQSIILSQKTELPVFGILPEPTPEFTTPNPVSETKIPDPKANAPPGSPPSESASRAPPVNL
jgi:hypothetical protein